MSRLRPLAVLAIIVGASLVGAASASAAGTIVFDGSPGTGPPPVTLGPYTMIPVQPDERPLGDLVTGVPSPSGPIGFSPALEHLRVAQGWATWSHGYAGDVYMTDPALSVTVTLPPQTAAFYLYAEPNPFAIFTIQATADDGTSSGPIAVDGFAGAQYYGFYGTGGATIETITVSSDIDFAIGEFGINGVPVARNYVALGDSYSSGEGVPPFFAGTDGPGNHCHRSPRAYAYVLGARYGMTPRFYACSGAVTANITTSFQDDQPPQLTREGVDETADLMTLTIGGNDAGFSDTLKACIGQKLKADAYNAFIGKVAVLLGFGHEPSCAKSDSFTTAVEQRIDNVFLPVRDTYAQIKSSTGPDTSVMAANYPHLFPDDHDDQDCLALEPILTNDTQDWMNEAGDRLDGTLLAASISAGVTLVDVRGLFAGHEICGEDGGWINGLSTASGNGGACTWEVLGRCIIPGLPVVGSFHPNATGHADGYAAAFAVAITSAADTTDAGFPRNPFALRRTVATPAVGVGTLTALPLTPGPEDCSGTFRAGQEVAVSGGGFVPGTPVELYASSMGFGTTPELLLATLTADANGDVSTVVRIPLAATGFRPEGAAAGIVFLDALGLGTAVGNLDDVAMVGLAAPGGSCGTVEELPFSGFEPPLRNLPAVAAANPGRSVPVKFAVAGSLGTVASVLAPGYPQSAPVSCSATTLPDTGEPTTPDVAPSSTPSDVYEYVWKTDRAWRGCRALIVKLVDGSLHKAVLDFGP
jgi:hypothetical protein